MYRIDVGFGIYVINYLHFIFLSIRDKSKVLSSLEQIDNCLDYHCCIHFLIMYGKGSLSKNLSLPPGMD